YTVTFFATDDGRGGTQAALTSVGEQITISVADVNRAPTISGAADVLVPENTDIAFTVTASDPDGDPVTLTADGVPAGASFDAATGAFSWTPTYDDAGTYTLTFTVTDDRTGKTGPSLSATQTVTLTVQDVNRAPGLSVEPAGDQGVDEAQAIQFLATATDPDNDAVTLSYTSDPALPFTAGFDPATGRLSWTPGYDDAGVYTLTFTATDDGRGGTKSPLSTSTTVVLTVNDVNRAPTLTRDPAVDPVEVDENAELVIVLDATDPDGDDVTITAQALDANGNPVEMPAGAVYDQTTETFTWTPDFTQAGVYKVRFTATDDGRGGTLPPLSDEDLVTIVVNNVNRAPALDPIGPKTVAEGQVLEFTVTGSDPDADPLTFPRPNADPGNLTGLPSGATFDAATGVFAWMPDHAQAGTYDVTFTVSDGDLTDSETIVITVTDTNRPPVLNPVGNRSVDPDAELAFTLTATDPDADNTLTFSASGLPAGATLDPATGAFSWTPTAAQAGSYTVVFRV
ncbi:MAG: tandem-95 repeat protein, partial [Candidatus Dadabacteria bacterium]